MAAESGPDPGGTGLADWRIADDSYLAWIDRVEAPALAELAASEEANRARQGGPLISVVMPVYNTPAALLREALDSVLAQSYGHWELCIVDDASTDPEVKALLEVYSRRDSRLQWQCRAANGGISAASNDALAMASGSYLALLDHDDRLAAHALLLVAMAALARPAVQLWYSDSDDLDQSGRRCNPFFKPAWNYELLLGQNYFNHLTVCSTVRVRELGGWRSDFDASQDYDLALRLVELLQPEEIGHIPHVLYHWRLVAESVARADLAAACRVARLAVAQHLERSEQLAEVLPAEGALIFNRVRRKVPDPAPETSLVVFGSEPEELAETASGLQQACDSSVLQVLVTDVCEEIAVALNNVCEEISTPLTCFFFAGIRVELQPWLAEVQGLLSQPGVAVVGPKLQSAAAGLATGPLRTGSGRLGIAVSCPGASLNSKGYFANLRLAQDVSALHGAVLAVTTPAFREVGGFSPGLCHPLLLGADICFKFAGLGQRCIWTPVISADCPPSMLAEISEPAPAAQETERFIQLWQHHLDSDPFYNPNFDQSNACYRPGRPPDFPPTAILSGNPIDD